jgi:hypothetical protein
MHSSCMLREGARPEVGRDNMGHANIDVTQNVYGKSWWGAGGCGHPSCRSRNQSSSFMIRMVLSYRLAMREREIRLRTKWLTNSAPAGAQSRTTRNDPSRITFR